MLYKCHPEQRGSGPRPGASRGRNAVHGKTELCAGSLRSKRIKWASLGSSLSTIPDPYYSGVIYGDGFLFGEGPLSKFC